VEESRPVRIAHCIDEMKVGGTQTQIAEMVRRLPERYQAQVLCLERVGEVGEALRARGVTVRAFGCSSLWGVPGVRLVRALAGVLRAEKIDILHAFLGTANLLAPLLGRLAGVKTVTSRRDTGYWMSPGF